MTRAGRSTRTLRLLVALWAAGAGASAAAKPPPEAVRLFSECLAVVEAERLAAARACFERLHAIYPSPVVLSNLARVEERLGHPAEAYEAYRLAAEDTTGALTTEEKRDLRRRLQRLVGQVGLVRLQVTVAGATVVIDGRRRSGPPGALFAVVPGPHEVAVEAAGHRPWRGSVTVRAGETVAVAVALAPEPAARPARGTPPPSVPPSLPVAAAPARPPAAAPAPTRPPRTGAWLTAGSGVALLGVGAAMAGLWAARAADVSALLHERDATGRPVPFSQVATRYHRAQTDLEAYRGAALGLGAAAAVAIGVSAYLFLRSSSRGAAERRRAGLRLLPALAPGFAGLGAALAP